MIGTSRLSSKNLSPLSTQSTQTRIGGSHAPLVASHRRRTAAEEKSSNGARWTAGTGLSGWCGSLRNERYGDPTAGQRPVCGREADSYAERRSGFKAVRVARPHSAEQSPSVFCCFRRRFAADVFEGHDAIALAGSTRHAIAERGTELRNGEQTPSAGNDLSH